MKRLLIASVIFAATTLLICALRSETARAAQAIASRRELLRAQVQHLEQLRAEREQLRDQMHEAKLQAAERGPAEPVDPLAAEFAASSLKDLSPENAERLLAELGLNWNSAGDFLFVSKTSLPGIRLSAFRGAKLTAAARAALAITPDEQAAIDAEVQRLTSEYAAWLRDHAQREEPRGDILAKYILTPDPQFSDSVSNAFSGVIFSTLGSQRATLLQQYSWDWMQSMGMLGEARNDNQPTSMIIRRQNDYLMLELRQSMGMMSCGLTPWQPVPEAFQPLFPGGWKDLAAREGFELPKDFQKE
jgi:hypothetical protein